MAIKYKWRERVGDGGGPGSFKTPAAIAGRELKRLAKEPGGLTPPALVDASRPKKAPLHGEFEWDNDVAAEAYRCQQARRIMSMCVEVHVIEGKPREIPVVSAVPSAEEGVDRLVRVATAEAMQNPEQRRYILERALEALQAWQRKYGTLQEFAKVCAAINEIDAVELLDGEAA